MNADLQDRFLDFHRVRGFHVHESFPLVINDPTILFTNATVTPFKSMFLGPTERKNFALVQKCLRLGGSGGDLETPRSNRNYGSVFDMLGSGLFDASQDSAVAYFIDVLVELGLRKEDLVFTMLSGLGFDQALERTGIDGSKIHQFADAKDLQHEWSFGEGDLHGCGVVARYAPEAHRGVASDNVLEELSRYVQIGRIVHIDGIVRGGTVDKLPFPAYDVGIGLSRVEIALHGNCESSMRPWRIISSRLQSSVAGLSGADAHYMANLYRISEELIGEGLLPGKKKQAYALRKVMRLLIEEIWLKSGALGDVAAILSEPAGAFPRHGALQSAFAQEEAALRGILSVAKRQQAKHPEMGQDELRATFGIRPSLLELV